MHSRTISVLLLLHDFVSGRHTIVRPYFERIYIEETFSVHCNTSKYSVHKWSSIVSIYLLSPVI